jgi:exodeoxyribonuclease VIII
METLSPGKGRAHFGLSSDDYHRDEAIGSSGLKLLAVSPLHYWGAYLDPERVREDKPAFKFGRAWHCAVFEPEEFGNRYAEGHGISAQSKRAQLLEQVLLAESVTEAMARLVVLPEGLGPTSKEGKALAAEITAAGNVPVSAEDALFVSEWVPRLAGREVLSADDMLRVGKMARIMHELPISRVVFGKYAKLGKAEASLFWRDPATGVVCKVRPDYMMAPCEDFPNGLIIDGKSTTDASPEGFGRQVWNLDYGLQAAFYTRVFQQVMGTAGRPAFLWGAQEKDSPHAAAYYAAGADLVEYWDKRIPRLLALFAECKRTGLWPGYSTAVQTLAMPAWAQKQMEAAA